MPDRTCSVKDCQRPTNCKGWCKRHYERQRRGLPLEPAPVVRPECAVDGCDTLARTMNDGAWCERHYQRWYRHGDPLATVDADGIRATPPGKYRGRYLPHHPLSTKSGKVYEHRAVLFDAIGYGPHACHWCGKALTWRVNLHVDHLDGVKDNNDPANLTASCQRCNSARAIKDRAIRARRAGYWQGKDAKRPRAHKTALRIRESDPLSA